MLLYASFVAQSKGKREMLEIERLRNNAALVVETG